MQPTRSVSASSVGLSLHVEVSCSRAGRGVIPVSRIVAVADLLTIFTPTLNVVLDTGH